MRNEETAAAVMEKPVETTCLYVAEMSTTHFEFRAVGRSEAEAKRLLLNAFKGHLKQYQVEGAMRSQWTVKGLEEEWGVRVWAATSGYVSRDFDAFTPVQGRD